MRHNQFWNTTTGHEVEHATDLLSFYDADAEFAVDLDWEDAPARTLGAGRWSVYACTLANITIGGKLRSREYLADLIGESEVRSIEDFVADDIDPNDLAE